MTFVKINGAEHKPNGRTINIKYLNFRAIIHKNPRYFWWFLSISNVVISMANVKLKHETVLLYVILHDFLVIKLNSILYTCLLTNIKFEKSLWNWKWFRNIKECISFHYPSCVQKTVNYVRNEFRIFYWRTIIFKKLCAGSTCERNFIDCLNYISNRNICSSFMPKFFFVSPLNILFTF